MNKQTISAFDIERGTRVSPVDLNTANILGQRKFYQPGVGAIIDTNKFLPETGTVVGHAGRMGDYVLVRWDGDPCSVEDTVHWRNLRLENGEPFAA